MLATAAFVNKDYDLCVRICENTLVLSGEDETDREMWSEEVEKLKEEAEFEIKKMGD